MTSHQDTPPSYQEATSTGSTSYSTRNGIPPSRRRSMEDEARPLPPGWVRQFDPKSQHQFFVDTTADPPRSIWQHPLDDEQYLSTLSPDEREEVTRQHKSASLRDIKAESSDDESGASSRKGPRAGAAGVAKAGAGDSAGARVGASERPHDQPHGLHKYARKLKDKVTNSTHEEREQLRRRRAEEERQAYEMHVAARRAMARAMETGQPQFLCKDRDGHDVYIEPPDGPYAPQGAYGYNPYSQGPYANPNVRFVRPVSPYSRPYGSGYGGGYGLPLVGGILGGALLGGLLF